MMYHYLEDISPEIVLEFFKQDLKFQPTQNSVSFPVLNRIFRRLKAGNQFAPVQIEQEALVDGHHRFVCLSMLNLLIQTVPVTGTAATIRSWTEVRIDMEDWDTAEQKAMYRERYD